ncbi:MAG: thioesterase family protein [Deltaproteobacteria bacterium]|nr:thioesterase family protein [Deltaproteobacteria bacterium]
MSETTSRVSSVHQETRAVSDGDIDMLGHVSNIAYVRWIQDVAIAHSSAVGLGVEAYRDLGAHFVVRRHEIDYLRSTGPSEVATLIERWSAATSVRRTRVLVGAREVVRATTTWAFIDASTGRPSRIPEQVQRAFAQQDGADDATRE